MNIVNDWGLEHSFTIAWCTNVADSSYVAVCYECPVVDRSFTGFNFLVQ